MAMGPGWTQTMSFGASPLISLQGVAPGEGEFGRVGLVACLLFYLAGDQSSTAKNRCSSVESTILGSPGIASARSQCGST